ncbi:Alpha-L-fucosidase [Bertholletia excelsa]
MQESKPKMACGPPHALVSVSIYVQMQVILQDAEELIHSRFKISLSAHDNAFHGFAEGNRGVGIFARRSGYWSNTRRCCFRELPISGHLQLWRLKFRHRRPIGGPGPSAGTKRPSLLRKTFRKAVRRTSYYRFSEKLGLPYLSAYLDSIGTNFRHGANFATGGSSIRPGGYSPFHLDLQISHFMQFKFRSSALYKQLSNNGNGSACRTNLPKPEDFSKALYTFDIGQNDLAFGFQHTDEERTGAFIPHILDTFTQAIHQLYKRGARFFWIHNTGPIGCLPYNVIYYNLKPRNLDKNGCVRPQNEVAEDFNKQLKNRVFQLRAQLPHAAITYVDVYSAKYDLISNAKNLGFVNPMEFCCGSYYGYHIDCGKRAIVNGTVYGNPCKNPTKHISWDGIHYSQAANLLIAERILNGSLSDPPLSLWDACHI